MSEMNSLSAASVSGKDRVYLDELSKCPHRVLATAAALHYCKERKLNAPEWATRPAADLLCWFLTMQTGRGQGKPGPIARYRSDMITYARWSEVDEVKEQQARIASDITELRQLLAELFPTSPTFVQDRRNLEMRLEEKKQIQRWIGQSQQEAYFCAAALLADSPFAAGPQSMEDAYNKVQSDFEDPTQAKRYFSFHPTFMYQMGLADLSGPNCGVSPPWELPPYETRRKKGRPDQICRSKNVSREA